MKMIISPFRKTMTCAALAIALSGGSLVTRANGVHATGDPVDNPKGSASSAEVKFIGSQERDFVLSVVYNNTAGSRFSVTVMDADGRQIYQSVYADKKFDRKFKITDVEGKFTFVIKNFQDNSSQSFEINPNGKLVEDIDVKEVK